ncbi:hypothetical protein [Sulfurimonas sp.]
MKLRVLISILFIIATTFTAVHELEHIDGEHDSSTCEVCIVDNHTFSADVVTNNISSIISFSFEEISISKQFLNPHAKKTANHSTAPPVIS